jgi:hypothetical protein
VMVGDVNIFFNDPDQDATFGEIEVMIAEPEYRRTSRGREALKIIMGYGNSIRIASPLPMIIIIFFLYM